MARFYDSVRDSDLLRVENLLEKGGIEYSLNILNGKPLVKEISVAEEDLMAAESILNKKSSADN